MQAVIEAPESAADMGPLTASNSLYEVPVLGATLIEHAVDTVIEAGADEIALNLTNNSVKHILGADRGVDTYEREDATLHFVRSRDAMTKGLDTDEGFLYVRADILYDADELASLADEDEAFAYVTDANEFGQGKTTVKADEVDDINPGQTPQTGATGAYAFKFPRQAHEWNYGIDPMSVEFAHSHQPAAVELSSFEPIRYPHQLLSANLARVPESGIGEDVQIADSASVRNVVLGEGVEIQANAVVEDAILMDGVTVGAGSYVSHTVAGNGARFGENTTTSDERADGKNVIYGDGQINSGLDEFGAVIGRTANVMPGVTLTAGASVTAGTTVQPGDTV